MYGDKTFVNSAEQYNTFQMYKLICKICGSKLYLSLSNLTVENTNVIWHDKQIIKNTFG